MQLSLRENILNAGLKVMLLRRSCCADPNALSERDDEVPRGIYFLFISAKAMATMEFLQREWINSGNFTGLGEERDPIVGLQEEGATFTIPKDPVRRRIAKKPRGISTDSQSVSP